MLYSKQEILDMMRDPRFPLSQKYDPDWILANAMGSHCLWLQEILAQDMQLKPGMRILDMGCGKGIGSIFLAREFGVQVWAADLWIDPTDNRQRICEMDAAEQVYPIRADANALPFADDFFDAMVSINSLFFYVTGGAFLREKILRCIKPGGEIGVVVPGFIHAYTDGIPEELKPHWHDDLNHWHTLDWWVNCFESSGEAEIATADTLPGDEGNRIFMKSMRI
mgnify:FL=1